MARCRRRCIIYKTLAIPYHFKKATVGNQPYGNAQILDFKQPFTQDENYEK